jgi:hypothetical protein
MSLGVGAKIRKRTISIQKASIVTLGVAFRNKFADVKPGHAQPLPSLLSLFPSFVEQICHQTQQLFTCDWLVERVALW